MKQERRAFKKSEFLLSGTFLSFLDSKLAICSFSEDPKKTPARLLSLCGIKMHYVW